MASADSKIKAALTGLVSGKIYAMSLPLNEDPDVFIVYDTEMSSPDDYGDDDDHEWVQYMRVHWYAKGRVNYNSSKVIPKIRNKLKAAGFTVSGVDFINYDSDIGTSDTKNGTGYTHICISCSIQEDDPYGES